MDVIPTAPISLRDLVAFLCPTPDAHGRWACSGRRPDESIYSQVIAWDGQQFDACIENMTDQVPWRLYLHANPSQGLSAQLNGAPIEVSKAVLLFCQERDRMPAPTLLVARPPRMR